MSHGQHDVVLVLHFHSLLLPLFLHLRQPCPAARRSRARLRLHPRPLLLQIRPPEPNRQCVLVRAVVGRKVAVVVQEVPPAGAEVPADVPRVADGGRGAGAGGLRAAGGAERGLPDGGGEGGERDEQGAAGDEGGGGADAAEWDSDEPADVFGRSEGDGGFLVCQKWTVPPTCR